MIKYSVIIPVYNVEQYLPDCLDSVLGQSLQELECICIDDASPDRCGDILDEYASHDKRVRVLHLTENHMQGYGRNRGMEMATGKYIYLLDSDDMITPEALEELYAVAEKDRLDCIYFDSRVIFANKELEIKNPILIGHSFCGRLSIIYASKYEKEKIVLLGSPCVRHEYKSFKQSLLKFLKKLKIFNPIVNLMKKHSGSADYRNASPRMREVLVKTVNEDLGECAKNVNCKALLIWGDKDTAVPVEQAKELDELLSDSKLIILPGTHYLYLEKLREVSNLINEFIKEEV